MPALPSSFSLALPPLGPTLAALGRSVPVRCAAAQAQEALSGLARDLLEAERGRSAGTAVALAEARASCAIESLPLTPPHHVEACRRALLVAATAMSEMPVCRRVASAVCREATGRDGGLRRAPGTALRRADGEVVYTPPSGEGRIADLLADWEAAMNDPSHDPLVQMAAGHAQFEAIHPFLDGNGRTGRILNIVHLMARGRLPSPLLCMSDIILRRRETYYRLLLAATEEAAWAEWTCFMLEVLEEGAAWTRCLMRRNVPSSE